MRTWELPPEPGPEVRSVRGRSGLLRHRDVDSNSADVEWRADADRWPPTSWGAMLDFEGPLVDATENPAPEVFEVPQAPAHVKAVRNRQGLWVRMTRPHWKDRFINELYPFAAPTWAQLLADGPLTVANDEVPGDWEETPEAVAARRAGDSPPAVFMQPVDGDS